MPLIVAKRDERDFAEALGAAWPFLSALCKVDGEPLKLEPYQLDFLRFEHFNSLRQTVDAYTTNINGFRHRFKYTIKFDAENANSEVAAGSYGPSRPPPPPPQQAGRSVVALPFFCRDVAAAVKDAPHMPSEERVAPFGRSAIMEQFESLALEDFQQELECDFVDESCTYFPYDLIPPCTHDNVVVAEDASDILAKKGRLVAATTLAARATHPSWRCSSSGPMACTASCSRVFAAQEAELRRLLN